MFPTRKITAATLAAAIAAVPATYAVAQDTGSDMQSQTQPQTEMQQSDDAMPQDGAGEMGDTAQAPETPETPSFDDAQIEAFASAVIEVTEIRDQYASELQGVEDEAQQQELIEQANTEMREAIEGTDGLTMDDYMAINRAASMDQELNQKIAQRLEEMQTEDAG